VRRHVSAEILALYREGAVSARKAAGIASHLSGCSQCTGLNSDLDTVSALLTATPLPPMPDLLVIRIQTAIATESALRAASDPGLAMRSRAVGAAGGTGPGVAAAAAGSADDEAAAGDAGAGVAGDDGVPGRATIPGRPDLPERGRRGVRRFRMPGLSSPLLLRTLAATGAVVIIAGGGFLLAKGQPGSEGSASSGGATASPRRPAASSGPAFNQAAAGKPASVSYRLHGKLVTTNAVVSHANFTRASLARQVRRDVASSSNLAAGLGGPVHAAQPAPTKSAVGGISLAQLEGCLSRVAAGRRVLLANIARYLGNPATIIVLKPLTAAGVFDVTIVGLACSASDADVISRTTVPTS